MALGSTQALTEMSTRNLPEDKGWPAINAQHISPTSGPIFQKKWDSRQLKNVWVSTAC
jgi:hypothetical protein